MLVHFFLRITMVTLVHGLTIKKKNAYNNYADSTMGQDENKCRGTGQIVIFHFKRKMFLPSNHVVK